MPAVSLPLPSASEPAPDEQTLGVLLANHRQFLGFLESRLGNRAEAEDVLQEAFVKGMAKLGDVRDRESVVAWFYRLLRNAVIDHLRRSRASGRRLDAFAVEMETRSEPTPELAREICRCVADLASTLKPEYAEVLHGVEVEGLSVKDFAARAGISSNNAAVRVFRAREALRRQVARSCGTCAEHGCFDCTCGAKGGCAPSGHHAG
jgi:RNA polymerase sigma-70 factor (ECF subfamily)